jgi:DNA-binding NarL/FixJ family response regulator
LGALVATAAALLALIPDRPWVSSHWSICSDRLENRISDIAVLTDAIRRVAEGECVIDPTIVARLLARQRDSGPLTQLTDRERDVLTLMAEGHSNQGICDKLFLSPKTVEAHISQIFSKLGLRDAPGYHRRVLAVLTFLRTQ